MLKSKKFWLVVILIIVTNIGTAVGCMWVAKKITAMHMFSIYSSMNFKMIENTKRQNIKFVGELVMKKRIIGRLIIGILITLIASFLLNLYLPTPAKSYLFESNKSP